VQVALETETTNAAAIKLYERLGFLRSKRLHRYYFNGNSAFRLILYLKGGGGCCGCPPGEEHNHGEQHMQ
jgi:peptide alpha-N-acetyltransferase